MDNYNLKIQLIGEIEEAIRVKELNVELMEQVAFTGAWLLKYCEANHITPPNLERLHQLIQRGRELVQSIYEPYSNLPTKLQQPDRTPDDCNTTNIKNLRKRWGSLTKDKRTINLNVNLIKAPDDVIDYIILHELCHVKINDHSRHYWDLVRKYMPSYQEKID